MCVECQCARACSCVGALRLSRAYFSYFWIQCVYSIWEIICIKIVEDHIDTEISFYFLKKRACTGEWLKYKSKSQATQAIQAIQQRRKGRKPQNFRRVFCAYVSLSIYIRKQSKCHRIFAYLRLQGYKLLKNSRFIGL